MSECWNSTPPNPGPALSAPGPMRGSVRSVREMSVTLAPVRSHSAEMLLIELMRCARKACAASLLSSALQRSL